MKKLLSLYCCILCIHSFRAIPTEASSSSRTSGERILVKALSALVNREGNKKATQEKSMFQRLNRPGFKSLNNPLPHKGYKPIPDFLFVFSIIFKFLHQHSFIADCCPIVTLWYIAFQ